MRDRDLADREALEISLQHSQPKRNGLQCTVTMLSQFRLDTMLLASEVTLHIPSYSLSKYTDTNSWLKLYICEPYRTEAFVFLDETWIQHDRDTPWQYGQFSYKICQVSYLWMQLVEELLPDVEDAPILGGHNRQAKSNAHRNSAGMSANNSASDLTEEPSREQSEEKNSSEKSVLLNHRPASAHMVSTLFTMSSHTVMIKVYIYI